MKILGTGSALPRKTVTNDMLSEFLDTSDEWITTRTGIKSRQIITDERFEELAALAAQRAIDAAGLVPEDIDFIICSNVVNCYVTPSLASLVQGLLGIKGPNCPTMDINSACAGFVYGLDICDAFLQTGRANRILYVCAEEVTRMVDWNQRETCVLFGDAAGAMVRAVREETFVPEADHHRMTREFRDFARMIDNREAAAADQYMQETIETMRIIALAAE